MKNDIAVGVVGVLPPMHLAGKDQEQVPRPDLISLEIDLVDTGSFCNQEADIKDMTVRQEDGLPVQLHMFGKHIGIEIGLRSDVFEIGDVIDRNSFMRHMSILEDCPDCPMPRESGTTIKLMQIIKIPLHGVGV